MQLSRLKLAIRVKQKMVSREMTLINIDVYVMLVFWFKFTAHSNVQQLLASIWYEGLPGFRRMNIAIQTLQLIGIGILFPLLSIAYIITPSSTLGKFIKKPFIKFICHSASYVTFLGKFNIRWFSMHVCLKWHQHKAHC